jgi:uncharacterized YigZ family protein
VNYLTPAQYGSAELVEKRSRFIGQVWPVETEDEARQLIDRVKAQYHDARHNCWCYILRSGAVRYSDDGEPQGTAGQPMLEVFRRGGVENVVCVGTRYFGGILLGTGGLARAYSGAAKMALDAAGLASMQRRLEADVAVSYALYERVKKGIEQSGGVMTDTQFGADVLLSFLCPPEALERIRAFVTEVSAGASEVFERGEVFVPVPVK